MISLQRTVTSIFLVPLLGIRRERLQDPAVGYVNGYLMDAGCSTPHTNVVYLVFQPKGLGVFNSFLQEERARTTGCVLVDEYDYEGGYVVLVYPLPPEADRIMAYLLNGQYSQFPADIQERYPKVLKITDPRSGLHRDEPALQWRIFKKDRNLRTYWEGIVGQPLDPEAEVWSVPDLERETFDREKLTANAQTTQ